MRKFAICAAAAAYVGTAGMAAAGGMKDAPYPAEWTGFYFGVGVGAGAVVHELDVNVYGSGHLNFDGIGGEGIFGTVQVGYDWQFQPRWVAGAFADFDWSGISTSADLGIAEASLDMNWMWTLGGRLGYLTTPDTLVYILAGYSQAKFDIDTDFGFSTSLDTFSGWTVGTGIETRLDSNWALKLEYRFTQLGSENLFSTDGYCGESRLVALDYQGGGESECGISADLQPSIHTGRVVLTYRLGSEPVPMEPLK